MDTYKICNKCLTSKELLLFNKDKQKKDGYRPECKVCSKGWQDKYREENKEYLIQKQREYRFINKVRIAQNLKKYKIDYYSIEKNKNNLKEYEKRYRKENSLKIFLYSKNYRLKNKDKLTSSKKIYYKENIFKIKEAKKTYYQNNKEAICLKVRLYSIRNRKRISVARRLWKRNAFKLNPQYKLRETISNAIRSSLKNQNVDKCRASWQNLTGYSLSELYKHLESKFTPEMSWSNHGTYWHIDHIIPQSWFKFTSLEDPEFKKCWSLSNLQPLEATKNIKKGNRFIG